MTGGLIGDLLQPTDNIIVRKVQKATVAWLKSHIKWMGDLRLEHSSWLSVQCSFDNLILTHCIIKHCAKCQWEAYGTLNAHKAVFWGLHIY